MAVRETRWPDHFVFVLGLAATFFLAVAGALLLIALGLEVLLGWGPNAMRSGSMAPLIRRGDVVLAQTVSHQHPLALGSVVVFSTKDGRTVAHRVVGVAGDGTYITKGDANRAPDSDHVASTQVRGVGRVLVPYVGLPFVWWREHRYGDVVLLALALLGCAGLVALPNSRRPGATAGPA